MNKELQRYGRNKKTLIEHSYIESGEYRRKFDKISNNKIHIRSYLFIDNSQIQKEEL